MFLDQQDDEKYQESLMDVLNNQLPPEFRGNPTAFSIVVNAEDLQMLVNQKK